jgi:hypothetical protein
MDVLIIATGFPLNGLLSPYGLDAKNQLHFLGLLALNSHIQE